MIDSIWAKRLNETIKKDLENTPTQLALNSAIAIGNHLAKEFGQLTSDLEGGLVFHIALPEGQTLSLEITNTGEVSLILYSCPPKEPKTIFSHKADSIFAKSFNIKLASRKDI